MRLIDADKLKEKLCYENLGYTEISYVYEQDIDEAKTAYVINHARWTYSDKDNTMKCTRCRKRIEKNNFRYCPNCGAKMNLK